MFMKFLFFPEFHGDISRQEQFCPAIFLHRPYHCVKPETKMQGDTDSCASTINVTAGVDVGHSGQGNEASELNGYRMAGCSQEK